MEMLIGTKNDILITLAFTKNKRKEQAGNTQASKTIANKDRIVSYIQNQNGISYCAGVLSLSEQMET